MLTQITRHELQSKLAANPGLKLLEALPEKCYVDGHLPGAQHMPHDLVAELAPRFASDMDAEIVVYCASKSCQNSHIAARRLAQMGYTNVAVYAEGKQDWIGAGLPTERAQAVQAA